MKFRIAFAIIGVFVGLSIAICFGFVYKNIDTACWGLMSGMFAGLTLSMHIKQVKDQWNTKSTVLRCFMYLGCLGQLASVVAALSYLVIAIVEKQALTPYGRGYYLSCVWSLMTWKWAFFLFYCARTYRRLYEERNRTNPDFGYQKI